MSCTVKNCKNVKRLLPAGCNISFHRFPHDKELFQEWLDVLALDKNIQWTKNRLVCSDHFTKEDFVPCGEVRRLKPNVVPSLKPRTVEPVFVDVNSPVFNDQLEQNQNGSCEYSTIEETVTEEEYPEVKSEYIEPVFVDVNQPFSEEHLELPVSANCNGNTMERVLSGAEDGSNSETLSSDINSTSDLIRCVQLDHQYLRKKLSGAQIRKLRRQKKMEEGTWTEHKPRHCDPKKSEVGDKSQTTEGNDKSAEGKKGSRQNSQTAPQGSRKSQGSYSDVASGVRMAIIDKRHPEVRLNPEQADLVQQRLVLAMDDAPTGCTDPLQFTKTFFSAGILWAICHNLATKTWLKETVASVKDIWEGADLTAVEFKDLPKRPRILALIPGKEESVESVRTRLEKQNPSLRVECWMLLSKKLEGDGVYMAFSVDEASFRVLARNQYTAFFKLGRITFKVLKGIEKCRM